MTGCLASNSGIVERGRITQLVPLHGCFASDDILFPAISRIWPTVSAADRFDAHLASRCSRQFVQHAGVPRRFEHGNQLARGWKKLRRMMTLSR
jgi:hypothetical protein